MFGAGGGLADAEVDEEEAAAARGEDGGLYMLAAEDVFRRLERRPDLNLNVSMFEIYGQKVRDLLAEGKELAALEDGKGVLQLVGLAQESCLDMDAFLHTTNVGRAARSTTATDANATSSRSHAAMLLRLVDNESGKVCGKFSFIDLAGAERGADHETGNAKTKMV
jgi:kinesin family protein 2/24